MGLKEYRDKRDFRRSPEPRGNVTPKAGRRLYIIQKHAASRLHYDFRLEEEGVLKSWAVPKGPSLDPKEKRLAVEVEDHPLEYGSFEGIIPEGEYGGGTVLLWDRGTWEPDGDASEGIRKGALKFRLDGEKLKGRWMLVRLKGDEEEKKNWILFKERDEEARPLSRGDILKERPESVATGRSMDEIRAEADHVWNSNRPANGANGGSGGASRESFRSRVARAAASRKTAAVHARKPARAVADSSSRGTAAATLEKTVDPAALSGARKAPLPRVVRPQLATLVKQPPAGDEWLHEIKFDGFRILCRIQNGRAQFITRNGKDWTGHFDPLPDAVARLPVTTALLDGEVVVMVDNRSSFQALQGVLSGGGARGGLTLFCFDLIHLDGYDLTRASLEQRKEMLQALLASAGPPPGVRFSDHVVGGGAAFFREACRLGLEGMISKRRGSPYVPARTRDWVKVKCVNRQEFVIGGFTEPSGARAGLGALMVGVHEGDELRFSGKVGTGFNAGLLVSLRQKLDRLEQKTPPFTNPPRGAAARGVHWVKPELIAEVSFTEWTDEGLLRHPSFQGLREDKSPREVRREAAGAAPAAAGPANHAGSAGENGEVEIGGTLITHAGRVLYPDMGLTKGELADYYAAVSDWMLPHAAGRPLTLVRCPEGRTKPCFFQKHVGQGVPESIDSVDVRETDGKIGRYLVIHDVAGLVALVQMGVLEIHPWGSRSDDLEKPDRLIFDLDPDAGLPWSRVVEAALRVRDRLEALGLKSWAKTTGGKGLHVVLPVARRLDWETVKEFARAVAQDIVRESPEAYTSVASKARRRGKVFIDYLRNARGATSVAPYSTRARDGAPVSAPIDWNELGDEQVAWTVRTMPARLAGLRRDPWQDLLQTRQSITAAMIRSLR